MKGYRPLTNDEVRHVRRPFSGRSARNEGLELKGVVNLALRELFVRQHYLAEEG